MLGTFGEHTHRGKGVFMSKCSSARVASTTVSKIVNFLQNGEKKNQKFSELAESNRRHLGNTDPITAERHSQLDEVRSQSSLKFLLKKLLYILYLCRSFPMGYPHSIFAQQGLRFRFTLNKPYSIVDGTSLKLGSPPN